MPIFLQISKHNPESCPMHNEKAKKATVDLMMKMDELTKKHKIKIVGMWNSMPEHLVVVVVDAPNAEVLNKFGMEPEVMTWSGYNTTEIRQVITGEESLKLMK